MPTPSIPRKETVARCGFTVYFPRLAPLVVCIFFKMLADGFYAPAVAQQLIPPDKESLLKGLDADMAVIADLNDYPDPRQVIAFKSELGLTRDQLGKTEALEKVVASAALAKGQEIVAAEEELAGMFEAGAVNEKILRSKLEQVGRLRADLRFTHLQAHLRMKQILTPDQIKRYIELRGNEPKREN